MARRSSGGASAGAAGVRRLPLRRVEPAQHAAVAVAGPAADAGVAELVHAGRVEREVALAAGIHSEQKQRRGGQQLGHLEAERVRVGVAERQLVPARGERGGVEQEQPGVGPAGDGRQRQPADRHVPSPRPHHDRQFRLRVRPGDHDVEPGRLAAPEDPAQVVREHPVALADRLASGRRAGGLRLHLLNERAPLQRTPSAGSVATTFPLPSIRNPPRLLRYSTPTGR